MERGGPPPAEQGQDGALPHPGGRLGAVPAHEPPPRALPCDGRPAQVRCLPPGGRHCARRLAGLPAGR
eukprot:7784868-Alexandrium_andersonii.AAC.1